MTDTATATISGNAFYGNNQGVRIASATAEVRGNEFVSNWNSVLLNDAVATLADNTIRGGSVGVSVTESGAPLISGNTVENAQVRGILVADGTSPVIEGNSICGSAVNLFVRPGARPSVGTNDVCPDRVPPLG